jgi:hypothetical protein
VSAHKVKRNVEVLAVLRTAGMVVLAAAFGAACEQHEPRSFNDFMEDAIARDGALARCGNEPSLANDIECANARRAASAVAVAQERAREAALERESERKLVAMRDRVAFEQRAERRAEAHAQAAAEAAYEAQWTDPSDPALPDQDIVAFAVYGQVEGGRPRLPSFELAAVTPPASDFQIAEPQLAFDDVTIPRPFKNTADVVAAIP